MKGNFRSSGSENFCTLKMTRQKGRKDITITSLTNVINVPQLKITTILM